MEIFRKTTRIRFMEQRRVWYAFSALIILGSIVLVAVRGLNFGIDFTGGIVIEAGYSRPADLEATRSALAAAGLGAAQVQRFGTANDVLVRLPPAEGRESLDLTNRATEAIRSVDPSVEIRRTEAIGPQVGRELAEKGATALLMTLLFIGLYVVMRFQWKFSVGATLAALHDPFVVVGFFSLTQMTFDLPVLSAILAVIGYSLNDTVVVFDRVRERLLSMRKATSIEVMNTAINETLSRTLMTSGTTSIVVVSLLVLGGEALTGFATALLVGIVVGTYSSIYVAGAAALDLGLSQRDLMPPEKKQEVDALP
ncbi:MAG: preprotein translocase subunit SecF [Gammaproteobacteria bacterium SG8_30]|jgi:preprotein translocase subunit SecF|nr:MAG: preprotein translocase subunit SecF [Gammaproteobacteria bacterium SG8_30]